MHYNCFKMMGSLLYEMQSVFPKCLPILIHFPMWAMIEQCLQVVIFHVPVIQIQVVVVYIVMLFGCILVCLLFNVYRLACFGR